VTKVRNLLGLTVAGVLLVGLAMVMLDDSVPSYQAAPRNHTPPHGYAVLDRKRPRVVRMRSDWSIPYTPVRIMYRAGADDVLLYDHQLNANAGSWAIEVPYDPTKTYVVEVHQVKPDAKATSCSVRIVEPEGFGFEDADVVHGSGTARCWVNAAT
jgi:hypothetical protein